MKGIFQNVRRRVAGGGSDSAKSPARNGAAATAPGSPQHAATMTHGESPIRSDVTLPRRERRRSSFIRQQRMAALKDLPSLLETPTQKREALFKQKLQLCCVLFNFDDAESDARGKELKRATLVELAEYVNTPGGQKIFTEALIPDILEMVRTNIVRPTPPQTDDYDPEEDEPAMEPAWPHLQVVYEFFLRFIVSAEVTAKTCKKYLDQKFCLQLIEMMDCEDPRERDYLKTVLHRIYGKFMSHRSFIRKAISNVFYRYVYETGRHNGIAELLEILGSIINGFAIPLKKEHLEFLEKALIPLQKPRGMMLYYNELLYCTLQYIEKDANASLPVVRGLVRYWPWGNSNKQVLFVTTVEEVLERIGLEQLDQVRDQLFAVLAKCVASEHFQVAERALYIWNNEKLALEVFHPQRASLLLPYVFDSLYRNAQGHWNHNVETMSHSILKMYQDEDTVTYEQCLQKYQEEEQTRQARREATRNKWATIAAAAPADVKPLDGPVLPPPRPVIGIQETKLT